MTNLTFAEALGISLLGFSIVFFVLIVLMAMIQLLHIIMSRLEKPAAVETSVPVMQEQALAKGSYGELKLYNVDEKTAAMLMAIVADEMALPLNELRFISIREKV